MHCSGQRAMLLNSTPGSRTNRHMSRPQAEVEQVADRETAPAARREREAPVEEVDMLVLHLPETLLPRCIPMKLHQLTLSSTEVDRLLRDEKPSLRRLLQLQEARPLQDHPRHPCIQQLPMSTMSFSKLLRPCLWSTSQSSSLRIPTLG